MINYNEIVKEITKKVFGNNPDLTSEQLAELDSELLNAFSRDQVQIIGDHNISIKSIKDSIVFIGDGNTLYVEGPKTTINIYLGECTIPINPINWSMVKLHCWESTKVNFYKLKDKYEPDLFVPRKELEQSVEGFIEDNSSIFLILSGRSGTGKTDFLCNFVEHYNDRDDLAFLIYDCMGIDQNPDFSFLSSMGTSFINLLGQRSASEKAFYQISSWEGFHHQKIIIVLDGINENKNIDFILRKVFELLTPCPRNWLKVIISTRPHAINNILKPMRDTGNNKLIYKAVSGKEWIDVLNFSEKETHQAYAKYQKRYSILPEDFSQLNSILRYRLREPLLLWLASEIFENKNLCEVTLGSEIDLIRQYTRKALSREFGDGIEFEDALKIISNTIPEEMVQDYSCNNKFSRDSLDGVRPDNDLDIITRLIKIGLLEEVNKRTVSNSEVHFRYERFYDYYFGSHLRQLVLRDKLLDCRSNDDPL